MWIQRPQAFLLYSVLPRLHIDSDRIWLKITFVVNTALLNGIRANHCDVVRPNARKNVLVLYVGFLGSGKNWKEAIFYLDEVGTVKARLSACASVSSSDIHWISGKSDNAKRFLVSRLAIPPLMQLCFGYNWSFLETEWSDALHWITQFFQTPVETA